MDGTTLENNSVADGWSRDPENADKFAPVPGTNNEVDFAVIGDELAKAANMLPLPIRLLHGKHFGSGGGYGIAHIHYHHGMSVARWKFYSIQDFVDHILQGIDAVYIGDKDRRIVVRRKDANLSVDRLLILELAASGNYYSVVTGFFVSARRRIKNTLVAERIEKDSVLVWECRAPH